MALMPVADALAAVLSGAEPLPEEAVALDDAFHRTLARDVAALRTQPPAAMSAMDGYAVRAADATLNARLKVEELAFQLGDADIRLFVCDSALEGMARDAARAAGVSAPVAFPLSAPDGTMFERVEEHDSDDPLLIMYTSGTTGLPKGVLISYGNLFASAAGSAFNAGVFPNDRWLACLPLFHIGGLSIVIRCVLYGTTSVLHRQFDERELSRSLRTQGVSQVSVVEFYREELLKHHQCLQEQREYFSEQAICGVERALQRVIADLEQLTGKADAGEVMARLLREFDVVTGLSAWSDPLKVH